MDMEAAASNDKKVRAFLDHQGQAILAIFFGVVNHWISIVVHKSGESQDAPNEIYVLDSSNVKHMDRSDDEIQAVQLEARCWSRIRQGLKPMDKWMVEYSIHSLVDQRVFYRKIN